MYLLKNIKYITQRYILRTAFFINPKSGNKPVYMYIDR